MSEEVIQDTTKIETLPFIDIQKLVYSRFVNNELLSYGHKLTVVPRESEENRNELREFARLSVFTNPPTNQGFGILEVDGFMQIDFFYRADVGHLVVSGWSDDAEQRMRNKVIVINDDSGERVGNIQFGNGNILFKGRDRLDTELGYASYRMPFCYYKRIH